jgi:hypothetical protein
MGNSRSAPCFLKFSPIPKMKISVKMTRGKSFSHVALPNDTDPIVRNVQFVTTGL